MYEAELTMEGYALTRAPTMPQKYHNHGLVVWEQHLPPQRWGPVAYVRYRRCDILRCLVGRWWGQSIVAVGSCSGGGGGRRAPPIRVEWNVLEMRGVVLGRGHIWMDLLSVFRKVYRIQKNIFEESGLLLGL